MQKVDSNQVEHKGRSLDEILNGLVEIDETHKLLVESVPLGGNKSEYIKGEPYLISCPQIETLLNEGWKVKQLLQQPWGVNGIAKPSHIILTVHLYK